MWKAEVSQVEDSSSRVDELQRFTFTALVPACTETRLGKKGAWAGG